MSPHSWFKIAVAASLVIPQVSANADGTGAAAEHAVVKQLLDKELVGASDKEILMLTVEYLAGGASPTILQ